jgi:outer membrane protein assembly factor BamE (lipoprotein component of BamABCDE complex)
LTHTSFRFLALGALLLSLAAGCTTTRVSQNPIDLKPWDFEKLEKGTTTKEEVIEMFGSPAAVTVSSEGVEIYTYASGGTASQTWEIPPIFVFYRDSVSSAGMKVLTVAFKDNVVLKWTYTVSSATGGFQAGGFQGGKVGE